MAAASQSVVRHNGPAYCLPMSSIPVTPLVPLHERPLGQRVAATIRAELARYDIPQTRVASALGLTQQAVSPDTVVSQIQAGGRQEPVRCYQHRAGSPRVRGWPHGTSHP